MTWSHLTLNKLSCLVFSYSWWYFEALEFCCKNAGVSWKYREDFLDRQNEIFSSCYLTKSLMLMLLCLQWHHGTLYTQKWSGTFIIFSCWKLAASVSTPTVQLCWNFGAELRWRRRANYRSTNNHWASLWVSPGGHSAWPHFAGEVCHIG